MEGIYRATFRDGNLETEIFPYLNRDGNNFPSLNRGGNCFPSLNRDGNCFPSLNRNGNCFPCLNRDGKISISKFPSLFFNFLVVCPAKVLGSGFLGFVASELLNLQRGIYFFF